MTTRSTARLLLRPLQEGDLPTVHRVVWSDPGVTWDGRARTLEESRAALRAKLDHWDAHGFGMCALLDRSTRDLVGLGGLQHLEGGEDVEVAYYLGRPSWGRGLATEVAQEAVRHGLEDLALGRVLAVVRPENSASQRVLAKVGLHHDHDAEHYGARVQVWATGQPPGSGG